MLSDKLKQAIITEHVDDVRSAFNGHHQTEEDLVSRMDSKLDKFSRAVSAETARKLMKLIYNTYNEDKEVFALMLQGFGDSNETT